MASDNWTAADGARLGALLKGHSLKTLAKDLGVTEQAIKYWIEGENGPKRVHVYILSEILRQTPSFIFFGQDYYTADKQSQEILNLLAKIRPEKRDEAIGYFKACARSEGYLSPLEEIGTA